MTFRRVNPVTGQFSYEAALIDDAGRIVTAPTSGNIGAVDVSGAAINVASSLTAVAATAVDVQGLAALANRRLTGFSITEAAATAAASEISLRHGTAATDPEIIGVNLAADGSVRDFFGPDGVAVPNGVFVDMVTGTAKLTLFWKTVA